MIWTTVTEKSVEGLRFEFWRDINDVVTMMMMMMMAIICFQSPLAHHVVQFTTDAFTKANLDDQICAIMQNVMSNQDAAMF